MPRPALLFILALACLVAAPAAGQSAAEEPPLVDPGVEDIGPLGVGRIDLRRNLYRGGDFDGVYRVGSTTDGRPLFARRSGGVTAVFPRSDYMRITTKDQSFTLTVVPPNTIFYLGELPDFSGAPTPPAGTSRPESAGRSAGRQAPSPNNHAPSQRVDLSAGSDLLRHAPPAAAGPSTPGTNIAADDQYRARRIRDLLLRAARTP